ncbi:MAG: hypothetical protein WEF50_18535 [Myxococcota bacterium]
MSERVSTAPLASFRSARGRIASVECLRLIAMFEIVSFHTSTPERLPILAGLGLPIFLMLTSAFSVVASSSRGADAVTRAKVRRLGGAWLFWCAVYGAYRIAVSVKHGAPPFSSFRPMMLLFGTAQHLWFAPFAIAASVVAANAQSWWGSAFGGRHVAVLIAVGFGAALLAGLVPMPMPLGQWVFALPSIPLGIALGVAAQTRDRQALWRTVIVLTALGAGAALFAVPLDPLSGDSLRRYAIALPLVLACFLVPGNAHPLVDRFAAYVPGVYFIHILVRDIAHPIAVGGVIAAGLIVFALSLLSVGVLARTPLRFAFLLRAPAKLRVPEVLPAPASALDAPPR